MPPFAIFGRLQGAKRTFQTHKNCRPLVARIAAAIQRCRRRFDAQSTQQQLDVHRKKRLLFVGRLARWQKVNKNLKLNPITNFVFSEIV